MNRLEQADRERAAAVTRIATIAHELRRRPSLSRVERLVIAADIEEELLTLGWNGDLEFPQVLTDPATCRPPWLT